MPTDDYDDYDEIEEVDELDDDYDDDVEDVEDVDEVDDADEVDDIDEEAAAEEKGRRQLQRGRLSEFSDRLTGGAVRPGEESVRRSPFVMVMAGGIIALTLIALIFFVMILSENEKRSFDKAMEKMQAKAFPEAEQRWLTFLEAYPKGNFAAEARINLHKARVMKYTESTSYTVEAVKEGVKELERLIDVCRDIEGFEDEHENVRRFAERMTRVAAIVAEQRKSNEALQQSAVAFKIFQQFAGENASQSVVQDLESLQRKAEAAILKDSKLNEALAEINGHLEAGDTFAALESRQALIDRYEALSDDAEVDQVLQNILAKEKELTTSESPGLAASTEEIPTSGLTAASLSLRTQARTDLVSRGTRVFAVGLDSCYGLDSETGNPVWKRSIGRNTPFAPTLVTPSQPDSPLLVFHTGINELLLLDQQTGGLIWRQTIPSRPSGPPLIFQQQIYLTTASGEIYRMSVDNGKIISKVSFNQPVIGPPTLTRDQKHLVIPGDQSVVYTLTVNPFECVAVSYIEHRLGSVEAPMLTLGSMLLLCDNDEATQARLRVMDLDASTGKLKLRPNGETFVKGQVRDACLLRGTELFVPSTPQRVSAFSVNDSPEADPPLSPIGGNQLPTSSPAPVHLLAGPQGQLWMASEDLRKFRVRTNAVELLQDTAARGVHLRPIQFKDQHVFVTTNESYSSSVFFSKVDPQKMEGLWRTVVGTHVVAASAAAGDQSLLAVGDFGQIFRIPLTAIRDGEFVLDAISQYLLPDKLNEQVGGLALKDGRVAAYCGGPEPFVWTFVPTGQLEQKWKLNDAPQVPLVSLADGVVAALPGRLQMTAVRGVNAVQDYRAAQGVDEQTSWKSLVAISDTQVVAINSKNEAVRVEYRAAPRPHLFEVSVTPLEQSVDLRPAVAGEFLAMCTSEGNLQLASATTLEKLNEVALGAIASAPPYAAGNHLFVEVSRRELKVFGNSQDLTQTATIPLDGRFLVGPPAVHGDGYVACLSDGTVLVLDADGQPGGEPINLGQDAQKGPIAVGNSLVVIGLDGSLYSLDKVLQ